MTTKQVQECIDTLESIDCNASEAYQLVTNAYKSIGQLPFFIRDYDNLPIEIFHSRTHDIENVEKLFEKISDIGLPPENSVLNYARCNIPNQPVFYCSENRPTSYAELLQYLGEEREGEFLSVTIGKWKIQNSLKLLIITSPYKEDRVSSYDKKYGPMLDDYLQKLNEDEKNAYIKFYKFLFDKFRKPAKKDLHTYMITSAYCNFAFNLHQNIDGIMYPSVPYQGQGVNFAIKSSYDFKNNTKLILVACDTFKRDGDIFKQSNHKNTQQINHDNNQIIWE